jgi:hypothetical protein
MNLEVIAIDAMIDGSLFSLEWYCFTLLGSLRKTDFSSSAQPTPNSALYQ